MSQDEGGPSFDLPTFKDIGNDLSNRWHDFTSNPGKAIWDTNMDLWKGIVVQPIMEGWGALSGRNMMRDAMRTEAQRIEEAKAERNRMIIQERAKAENMDRAASNMAGSRSSANAAGRGGMISSAYVNSPSPEKDFLGL